MPYMILTGLMLLEVLLVIGGILLFRRFAGRRCAQRAQQQDTHSDRLQAFLEFEIQRMQKIIEETPPGNSDRAALEKRLSVFDHELNILVDVRASGSLDEYPALITKYYSSFDMASTPEFDKLQDAIGKYQERIDNLEQFRTLFFRSQDDLAQSVNRAVDLKRRLDEEILNEEEQNKLIQMLKDEKARLGKELNIADHELEAIMANIGMLHSTSLEMALPDKAEVDAVLAQMRSIEEENEFLQVQIQHLLKAEIEQDKAQDDELEKCSQALAAQLASYVEMEAKYLDMETKFVEMEARYLKVVG